jgi:uncharacterized protein
MYRDRGAQPGHRVTGFSRSLSNTPKNQNSVTWKAIDVLDPDNITAAISGLGLDVLVSTYQPGNAARDLNDTVERSIRNPDTYVKAAKALLKALEKFPALRLIVVGGAGSLEIEPGVTRADSPDDLRASMKLLGLPEAYEAAVRGHRERVEHLSNIESALDLSKSGRTDLSRQAHRPFPSRGRSTGARCRRSKPYLL